MSGRYIVVEGPIAVGKTSLAERLAESIGARLVLEETEENPFLRKFYENPEKYAFAAQIFFLLSRYRQQFEIAQRDLFEQAVVADYFFAKDQIFARLNLDSDEYALYQQIYRMLDARTVRPDLVVYLEARVAEAYRQFFYHYTDGPLLVVQSSEIDFVERPADFDVLLKEIRTVKKGVQHYVPLGSRGSR